LWVVETVDSLKLAKELNKHLETNKTTQFNSTLQLPLNIYVQVKTSDEESKSGVAPDNCIELVKTIKDSMPNLKVCGLMTIGKLHGDPSEDFKTLRNTRSVVATALDIPIDELELSMGMSSDFETAVRLFFF
jgi:pyridoxal phosphate enzyme (YggS family)